MEKIIRKRQGWDGLMVKVEASLSWPGYYEIGVYYPGWIGIAFSPDGMGWEGAGFHGTEDETKAIIQVILKGIKKERETVEKIVVEYAKKKLAEALDYGT